MAPESTSQVSFQPLELARLNSDEQREVHAQLILINGRPCQGSDTPYCTTEGEFKQAWQKLVEIDHFFAFPKILGQLGSTNPNDFRSRVLLDFVGLKPEATLLLHQYLKTPESQREPAQLARILDDLAQSFEELAQNVDRTDGLRELERIEKTMDFIAQRYWSDSPEFAKAYLNLAHNFRFHTDREAPTIKAMLSLMSIEGEEKLIKDSFDTVLGNFVTAEEKEELVTFLALKRPQWRQRLEQWARPHFPIRIKCPSPCRIQVKP